MPQVDGTYLTFDWVMLGLRVAFIALIYIFLYQVAQVALRELVVLGRATARPASGRPQQGIQASLVVWNPAGSSLDRGARIPISTYTTVGRSPDNSLVLDDGFTSGHHAELVRDGDGWSVRDLSSTNGTFVNDHEIHAPEPLTSGDTIRFGEVIVEFHA